MDSEYDEYDLKKVDKSASKSYRGGIQTGAYLGYHLYDNYMSDEEMADLRSYGCGVI